MKLFNFYKRIGTLVLFCFVAQTGFSQWEQREIITNDNITYPETSKLARISNTIGITEIELKYHRPAVRNRNVFGGIIPYNKVWRAGANESTTISFQDKVKINGHELDQGKYGIHVIPAENEWTIIFSKNHTQWGSFYYNEKEDALRIKVKPEKSKHQEFLKYDFENITDNSASIILNWDKTKISFHIEVNEITTTIAIIEDELRTLPRFSWRGNREAALFCWLHDSHLDKALEWINRSIDNEERFENIYLKALILASLNDNVEADKFMKKARGIGNENKFMFIGFEALGHHNSPEKAIELFKNTHKYFPNSYRSKMYIGNVYGWMGKLIEAKKAFKEAMDLTSTEKEKTHVRSIMARYQL